MSDQLEKQNIQEELVNEQEDKPVYMFYYTTNENGEQQIAGWIQEYYDYFLNHLDFIGLLRETVNKNWKDDEYNAYILFLNDLQNYIHNVVFQGYISDFNAFIKEMQNYGENVNQKGYQLYNRQCDYLEKKESGYDFNLEKKKKKKEQPKQEQKQKPREEKKQQEVIVRKDDPTTTAEQLKNKAWQPNKYTDMQSFHLESANLIFIGHVDSGKSTLTGNIMKELKLVDEQQLTRNKQEAKEKHMQAFQMGFISDFDPSERLRGKTLECAKLMFSLNKRRFTLFDAPGHKNYVPSMIMGACQADIAVLIVSAKQGEFQSGFEKEGQTKEHAMLAKALGVQSLIVAVTKMGTVDWSESRYSHIKGQVAPFLQNSCGFSGVQFIPVDSLNNSNIHSKFEGCTWYKGHYLAQLLEQIKLPQRDPDGPLRIPIIDKFKDVGQFYIYGKVESGKIAYQGQTVSLLPHRQYVIIREIYNAKDEKLPYALAGQNVKLKIKGSDENIFRRGDMLCSNNNYCQESMEFKANLNVLELPEHKKIMSSGYECIIHLHAVVCEAEISLIEAKTDKQTGKSMKATYLLPGEKGNIVIKLKNSACLQKFDFMPTLGRFTLRDEGKTIGYGEVTKIKPAKTLTKEQKDQLGVKTEEKNLAADLEKVNIN